MGFFRFLMCFLTFKYCYSTSHEGANLSEAELATHFANFHSNQPPPTSPGPPQARPPPMIMFQPLATTRPPTPTQQPQVFETPQQDNFLPIVFPPPSASIRPVAPSSPPSVTSQRPSFISGGYGYASMPAPKGQGLVNSAPQYVTTDLVPSSPIIVEVSSPPLNQYGCQQGEVRLINRVTYRLKSKEYFFSWDDRKMSPSSWRNAESTCKRYCMKLATPMSEEELDFFSVLTPQDITAIWTSQSSVRSPLWTSKSFDSQCHGIIKNVIPFNFSVNCDAQLYFICQKNVGE